MLSDTFTTKAITGSISRLDVPNQLHCGQIALSHGSRTSVSRRTDLHSLQELHLTADVSGGVLADGVSLHPVRIKRLRNISSLRIVGALGKITETRVWRNTWGRKGV